MLFRSSATRLTSTYFAGNSTNMGAVGGLESSTLVTGNLPAYTPTGTIGGSVAPSVTIQTGGGSHITPPGGGSTNVPATNEQSISISATGLTFTGTAQGGTSTPVRTVQPTIVCNYIIRII